MVFRRCSLKILKIKLPPEGGASSSSPCQNYTRPSLAGREFFFAGWASTGPTQTRERKKGHLRELLGLKKTCFQVSSLKISNKERKLSFCLFTFSASLIKTSRLFHSSWKLVQYILFTLYFPRRDTAFDTFFPGGHRWKPLICVMCAFSSFLAVLLHMRQRTLQLELSKNLQVWRQWEILSHHIQFCWVWWVPATAQGFFFCCFLLINWWAIVYFGEQFVLLEGIKHWVLRITTHNVCETLRGALWSTTWGMFITTLWQGWL